MVASIRKDGNRGIVRCRGCPSSDLTYVVLAYGHRASILRPRTLCERGAAANVGHQTSNFRPSTSDSSLCWPSIKLYLMQAQLSSLLHGAGVRGHTVRRSEGDGDLEASGTGSCSLALYVTLHWKVRYTSRQTTIQDFRLTSTCFQSFSRTTSLVDATTIVPPVIDFRVPRLTSLTLEPMKHRPLQRVTMLCTAEGSSVGLGCRQSV